MGDIDLLIETYFKSTHVTIAEESVDITEIHIHLAGISYTV